jgi:hypothetical protein
LLAAVVAWVGRHPALWAFAIVWPIAMFFAVIVTGNHFILDAVFGAIVSFAGLGVALALERWWRPAWQALTARLLALEPVE